MEGEQKAVEVEYISNTVPIDKLKALIERETVQVYWKGGSSNTWVKVHEVDSDEGVMLKETYADKEHRKSKVLDTGSSIECDEEIVNGEKEMTKEHETEKLNGHESCPDTESDEDTDSDEEMGNGANEMKREHGTEKSNGYESCPDTESDEDTDSDEETVKDEEGKCKSFDSFPENDPAVYSNVKSG